MDLILANGTVIDPASERHEVADVGIVGGRVARIASPIAEPARRVVDCTGTYVVPGLVDAHTHIFAHVSTLGAPVEEGLLQRGVVAAADAGSAGASTYEAFQRFVVEPAPIRVLSFLNVSVLGVIDFRFGELLNPHTLSVEDALETARTHSGTIRGFKIRLSEDVVGERCLPLLEASVRLAREAGLPLMVHIGETGAPLSSILERLGPGDVVSHCYTGKPNGIFENGKLIPEVERARFRGVLFDSAHGRSNFSFAVARSALAEGFLPDVISSDTSLRNWRGPVYDLVTTMSKFLALGVSLDDIIKRTTMAAASLLGIEKEGFGRVAEGQAAHVTVLRLTDEVYEFRDAVGAELKGPRLEPYLVVNRGNEVSTTPWRGAAGGD
jgi:dihydroorotase